MDKADKRNLNLLRHRKKCTARRQVREWQEAEYDDEDDNERIITYYRKINRKCKD